MRVIKRGPRKAATGVDSEVENITEGHHAIIMKMELMNPALQEANLVDAGEATTTTMVARASADVASEGTLEVNTGAAAAISEEISAGATEVVSTAAA